MNLKRENKYSQEFLDWWNVCLQADNEPQYVMDIVYDAWQKGYDFGNLELVLEEWDE